jgi:hypothetical protein
LRRVESWETVEAGGKVPPVHPECRKRNECDGNGNWNEVTLRSDTLRSRKKSVRTVLNIDPYPLSDSWHCLQLLIPSTDFSFIHSAKKDFCVLGYGNVFAKKAQFNRYLGVRKAFLAGIDIATAASILINPKKKGKSNDVSSRC